MAYYTPKPPYDRMSFRLSYDATNFALKLHDGKWFIYSNGPLIVTDMWTISASDEDMEQMIQDGIIDRVHYR